MGNTSTPTQPTREVISASVPASVAAEVRAIAIRDERTVSQIVRFALREYLGGEGTNGHAA